VQHITQTAPYARQLLVEGFKGNIAEFILFIQFVFSCLHRRSDLAEQSHEISAERPFPFAVDRTSRDPHATAQALQRARYLRRLFTMTVLRDMKARVADLPAYLPISQAELILEMQRLELELGRARVDIKTHRGELDRITHALTRTSAERREFAAELERSTIERERLAQECTRLEARLEQGVTFASVVRRGLSLLLTLGSLTALGFTRLRTGLRSLRTRLAARRRARWELPDEDTSGPVTPGAATVTGSRPTLPFPPPSGIARPSAFAGRAPHSPPANVHPPR
jgi:hypothetical protein